MNHVPRHVCQAEVAALEFERQLEVIEAEQVQDDGVQVVDVGAVLDGVEAKGSKRLPVWFHAKVT